MEKIDGILHFKIRYQQTGGILDKRKIKKGFRCAQINDKTAVQNLYEKILPIQRKKMKIYQYCNEIEKELRRKQFYTKNKRWFYDYFAL